MTRRSVQGATGAIVFTEAGSYPFFCKVHPATMTGTITVSG
ncbi:MAG: plastocyanin/azurin family copper-binding protein [Candidatus Limnocylindrales bacterium]